MAPMSNANLTEMTRAQINDEMGALCDADDFDAARFEALSAEQSRRFQSDLAFGDACRAEGHSLTTEQWQALSGGTY